MVRLPLRPLALALRRGARSFAETASVAESRSGDPFHFIFKNWKQLYPGSRDKRSYQARRDARQSVAAASAEDSKTQKLERVRALIRKHLEEEGSLRLSPTSVYYILRRDVFAIFDAALGASPVRPWSPRPAPTRAMKRLHSWRRERRNRHVQVAAEAAPPEGSQAEEAASKDAKSSLVEKADAAVAAEAAPAEGSQAEEAASKDAKPSPVEKADAAVVHKLGRLAGVNYVRRREAAAVRLAASAASDAATPTVETAEAQHEVSRSDEEAVLDRSSSGYEDFNFFVLESKQAQAKERDMSDGWIYRNFVKLYKEEDERMKNTQRRLREKKLRSSGKGFGLLNAGYKEEEEEYEAEEVEFKDHWREKSILEDLWKAEKYRQLHRQLHEEVPERAPLGAERSDRFVDVLQSAFRKEYLDQHRPVLTHELADYDNPYMMKRSAMERLLQERCVRNELDERVMPRLLDQHPDLVKLRRRAALPPEALEPLAAFRGDVRWSFDAKTRLEQKLRGVDDVLDDIEKGAPMHEVLDNLPEKRAENPPSDQLEGVHHPWRNHLGFESAVPRGVAGGIKFGQPESSLSSQLGRMRYPTMQRVAHTLPKDPKYRAHVVRSIRVLERSRDWDFESKLDAINRMKEIYDTMKDSQEYTSGLDEKLVVNRVPPHTKRKYAPEAQYNKTVRKNWYKEKSFYRYRPSLTATAPLGKKKK